MADATVLVDGLASPEGPDVLEDGTVVFVETFRCRVSAWTEDGGPRSYADVGGAPNACMAGLDAVGGGAVISERVIRVTHANWSPINGRRGQVEENVEVTDVSPANDWTQVRVYYAPLKGLGTSAYPTNGFIYATSPQLKLASAQ